MEMVTVMVMARLRAVVERPAAKKVAPTVVGVVTETATAIGVEDGDGDGDGDGDWTTTGGGDGGGTSGGEDGGEAGDEGDAEETGSDETGDEDTGTTGEEDECDEDTEVTLYLSPDDSNSMSSPVQARERIQKDVSLSGINIRPWEFMNYYHFNYAAPSDDQLAVQVEMGERP